MTSNAPQTNVGLVPEDVAAATRIGAPIDVWLRFDSDADEATYEANTFRTEGGYRVEWYHDDVGEVSTRAFASYVAAQEWLTANDYQDYSS